MCKLYDCGSKFHLRITNCIYTAKLFKPGFGAELGVLKVTFLLYIATAYTTMNHLNNSLLLHPRLNVTFRIAARDRWRHPEHGRHRTLTPTFSWRPGVQAWL